MYTRQYVPREDQQHGSNDVTLKRKHITASGNKLEHKKYYEKNERMIITKNITNRMKENTAMKYNI